MSVDNLLNQPYNTVHLSGHVQNDVIYHHQQQEQQRTGSWWMSALPKQSDPNNGSAEHYGSVCSSRTSNANYSFAACWTVDEDITQVLESSTSSTRKIQNFSFIAASFYNKNKVTCLSVDVFLSEDDFKAKKFPNIFKNVFGSCEIDLNHKTGVKMQSRGDNVNRLAVTFGVNSPAEKARHDIKETYLLLQ